MTTPHPLLPPTMHAYTSPHRSSHPRKALPLTPNLPTPPFPTGSQLLLHLTHAALNPGTLLLLSLLPSIFRPTPFIPELEFAGTIITAGSEAPAHLQPGTHVYGCVAPDCNVRTGKGALAEYLLLDPGKGEGVVERLPEGWKAEEAVGLISGGATAVRAWKEMKGRAGMRVLVNGASGGTGSVAVQVFAALGARVTAVCSGRNAEWVEGLGAREVIDYTQHTPSLGAYLAASRPPFDAILDCVGSQDLADHAATILQPDGTYVHIGFMQEGWGLLLAVLRALRNMYLPACLGGVPRAYRCFSTAPTPELVRGLKEVLAMGKVKPVVGRVVGFGEVVEGYEIIASKRARGKVVVKIREDAEVE